MKIQDFKSCLKENAACCCWLVGCVSLCLLLGCTSKPPTPADTSVHEKESKDLPAPLIKVYVENSGSMDGYVKGVTDFENAVYSYLSALQLADLGKKDSSSLKNRLEFNYINSKTLPYKGDLEAFIKNLEPYTFRIRGGNRNASDMSVMLDSILRRMDSPNDVSVFISDCIFSPGRTFKSQDDADGYLKQELIDIQSHLAEHLLKAPDLAVVVLRLISQFDGYYYNKYDDKTHIKDNRPFYICLLGDKLQLKRIMDKVDTGRIKGSGVQNMFMVSRPDAQFDYDIAIRGGQGEYTKTTKNTVKKAKVERKGGVSRFQLPIDVDFSGCLLEDGYLLDVANYSVSNKAYSLEISKNNAFNSSYTHVLKLNLEQPIISKGGIKITLLNKLPSWIEQYTDEEGLDIHAPGAMEKTYGLKYLMEGIYDAYSLGEEYGSITVNIK